MKLSKTFNYEIGITTVGRISALALNFILYLLLFKTMELNDFAEYSLVNGIQSFLLVVVSGPIQNYIGRETWVWYNSKKLSENLFKYLQPVIIIFIILFIFTLLFSLLIKWLTYYSFLFYISGIFFYTLWILFSSLFNAVGILRNRYLFTLFLVIDGISKIGAVYFSSKEISLKSGSYYFFIIQLSSFLGTFILYLISKNILKNYSLFLKKEMIANFDIFKINTYKIFTSNKSLSTSALFNWGASTGNRYVLEPLLTKGQLAIFIAGFNLGSSVLNAAEGFFTNYMLPLLYNHSHNNETKTLSKETTTRYLILWLAYLLPLLFIFVLHAEELINITLGVKSVPIEIVRSGLIYSFGILFIGVAQSFSLIYRNYYAYIRTTFLNFFIGISLLFLITKYINLNQGVYALAITSLSCVIYFLLLFNRNLNYKLLYQGLIKILYSIFIIITSSFFIFKKSTISSYLQFFLIAIVWVIVIYTIFKNWLIEFSKIE
jgi:O-antigen/teichoic acid export membrane protein